MPVQDALSTVLEYNAAMELAYSGLLGIRGAQNPSTDRSVIETELQTFSNLCHVAERALSNEAPASQENLCIYSALDRLFHAPSERQHYRSLFHEGRLLADHLMSLIAADRRDIPAEDLERTKKLETQLRELSDLIRHNIPRDAHLASITGRPRVTGGL
jgi:hypothetical protein